MAEAAKEAWGSGMYARFSQGGQDALDAATAIPDFPRKPLAHILASTASGKRGHAVWRHAQAACGN